MSSGITVTLLAGLMLTCCLTTGGCGRREADRTWYDSQGHQIAENWKINADGKRVPDPHPYDRYGHPWVYDANGVLMPPPPPGGTRYYSSGWLWGGSGYRSASSGSSYRSSTSGSSSSSISRGGFGSTGSSASSSS